MATVACARPLEAGSRLWIVGIALESPGNLWCIAPAPDDWGNYSAPTRFSPASVRLFDEALSALLNRDLRTGKA